MYQQKNSGQLILDIENQRTPIAIGSKLIICSFTLIFAAQILAGAYHFFEGNLFILVRINAVDPTV